MIRYLHDVRKDMIRHDMSPSDLIRYARTRDDMKYHDMWRCDSMFCGVM